MCFKMWHFHRLLIALVLTQQTFFSEAKLKMLSPSHCCKAERTPASIQRQDQIKQLVEVCAEEMDEPKGGNPRAAFTCTSECVMKKLNMINEDNTLNEDSFKNFVINELATQDYQKSVAPDVALKCLEKAKGLSLEGSGEANASKCSKMPQRVSMCVMREFMSACPDDQKDESEYCVKMFQHISSTSK